MKTLIAIVIIILSFSSLSAQVQRDTVNVNGWYFVGIRGGTPTSYTAYSHIVRDTSTEGNCSQAFDVKIPMGTTALWRKKLNHPYPRPWGISYDKMLSLINPNDVFHITDLGVDVYLHYSDRDSDTLEKVPLTDNTGWLSEWSHIKRPIYLWQPSVIPSDSVDEIVMELGFDPTMSGSFELLFDNFNLMYCTQVGQNVTYDYILIDRFGDPDPISPTPKLSYSPSYADFGVLPLSPISYRDTLVTFRNTGSDTVKGKISIVGSNVFSVDDTNLVIVPMDSVVRKVRFAPAESGSVSGYLVVKSNDPSSPDTVFLSGSAEIITGVTKDPNLPVFSVSQNYPNPFNPTTTIGYSVPKAGMVKLSVFNVLGQEVKILVNGERTPGTYQAQFNGTSLPSGAYFARLEANGFTATKKMVLLK